MEASMVHVVSADCSSDLV